MKVHERVVNTLEKTVVGELRAMTYAAMHADNAPEGSTYHVEERGDFYVVIETTNEEG